MFPRALRIGSIAGVDVRVDPSLLVIALLVAVQFWFWFAQRYAHGATTATALALVATFLFFASILAHELGHALEALHRDVPVAGITLFLFGGVTETRMQVRRPRDEFALAAVGPYVSFVVAALLGLVATWAAAVRLQGVADVAGLLAWLNLILGLFNLIPGAPLDGGRVLRSLLWAVTGDRNRAVRYAARSGQVIGALLLAAAGWGLLTFGTRVIAQGIWLGLIGWFLFRAANGELQYRDVSELVADRAVGSLVPEPPLPIAAHATLVDVLEDLTRSASDAHPVIEANGQLVGVLRVEDAGAVGASARSTTTARDAMCPIEDVAVVDADTPVVHVASDLERAPAIAVFQDGDLIGLASGRGFRQAVDRLHQLHDGAGRTRRDRS